ncbi:het-domain protein [Fusarium tjaetaba]|uniref:Het-domain protein n=1 Tax=Fusarium tjaetaba TaxID=1567544 RepID=A0A8H5QUU7_9HYPO|nr:het-domain protein [Fusarium tjaetaba]KAF5621299.1 het-domain protein [Fusarium tjaetaba]
MRLLTTGRDGERGLADFVGDHIPPYTILSHTWGKDCDEVTFQDMIEGKGKNNLGYEKLLFCEKQSANDNIQFFWVDTCCIHKTSSVELSEAIDSTYHWYHNADVRYVYFSMYQSNFPFILHRGSALHEIGDTLKCLMGDVNRDGWPDMVAFKSRGTSRHMIELSVLSGASLFRTFIAQITSGLPVTKATQYDFALVDWDGGKKSGPVVNKKGSNDTKTIYARIFSGASNLQDVILQTGTAPTKLTTHGPSQWEGINGTKAHVLSGASGFQECMLPMGTCLHETNAGFHFAVADWNADGCSDTSPRPTSLQGPKEIKPPARSVIYKLD